MIRWLILLSFFLLLSCGYPDGAAPGSDSQPNLPAVLLITLDTTRADHMGGFHPLAETPHFDALAASGTRFQQAYTTVPITLPAHTSMMTGQYPGDHGVHENARTVPAQLRLLAETYGARGYHTAAAVSAFPLARELGIARGFADYDDSFSPAGERDAGATTTAALRLLDQAGSKPFFLWVHYFDPHDPYEPPEPFKQRFAQNPYLGEIAYMDQEMGRLLAAFKSRFGQGDHRILVVGDHGESLGEHGEAHHGNLLFQGAVHVPLAVAGTGISQALVDRPVSIRRVYHTLLRWIGEDEGPDLFQDDPEPVLAEAMKPFLHYGWSPQVMALSEGKKYLRSADMYIFDLASDPGEQKNLAGEESLPPQVEAALAAYPIPGANEDSLSQEQRERLASLGYAALSGLTNREGPLPDPIQMTHLFPLLEQGARQFGRGDYVAAIATYEQVLAQDPQNLMVLMRQAVAHSVEGRRQDAEAYFRRAGMLDAESLDLHHYLGMHYLRFGEEDKAAAQFRKVLQQWPQKLTALTALAGISARSGQAAEAIRLFRRAAQLRDQDPALQVNIALLAMEQGDSTTAAAAFAQAYQLDAEAFAHQLDYGVVLMDLRRFDEAAGWLDQIPANHPGYPMALYKRAQAAVLRNEPDPVSRIRRALDAAPPQLRDIIRRDPLLRQFQE